MSMAERIIYEVINEGLAAFKADPTRFESFLAHEVELPAEEAAQGRLYFEGGTVEGVVLEPHPPTLVHGYARPGGPFPVWALTLGSERQVQAYLADDDGDLVLGEDGLEDGKTRRVEYAYNIMVLTENPDVTLWYYHLLKNIILSQRAVLIARHLDEPLLTGADLAPDPRYLPANLYGRILTLTIQTDEQWSEEIAGGYGNKVSGIHRDDGEGRTAGVGSVAAGVKTYTED